MEERRQDPDPADAQLEKTEEGPPEIIEAAMQELENPADESDEG
jgi:hypothetical protein